MTEFVPTAWVRTNCPYSFKFRLFVVEAGLAKKFHFVPMTPGSKDFEEIKSQIEHRSGRKAQFPTVEVAPGTFMTDSDELIEYFAAQYGKSANELETLSFYRNGIFLCYVEMFSILARPLGWIARLGRRPFAFR